MKGPHFIGLHGLFDKIAEEVQNYVDMIAERIAQPGGIAVGAQGRFWEMHDLLFENQDALEDEALVRYAKALRLDAGRFVSELQSGAHEARIREDFRSKARSAVNGAPSFFINGARYDGMVEVEELHAAISGEPE